MKEFISELKVKEIINYSEADQKINEAANILWNYFGSYKSENIVPSDCAIILGSTRTDVPEYAARLYKDRLFRMIVCSGGNSRATAKWPKTEAETFASILIQHGVSESDILLEKNATNMGENIRFSKELLYKHGINPSAVTIVTFHPASLRAYHTALKQLDIQGCSIQVTSPWEDINYKGLEWNIKFMLSELDKLTNEYPQKGYTVQLNPPEEILSIYKFLKVKMYF